jgi:Flp pilus assembly protein TadG
MRAVAFFRRLLNDDSGVSIIQFAIVAPAFIALMIAIIQTALVYLAQGGLETAAEQSGRLLMTGQAQTAKLTAVQFKNAACNYLPPFMNCSNLQVDVRSQMSLSGADTGSSSLYDSNNALTLQYDPGTQGAIVVVRLLYSWPTVPGPFGFTLANQTGSNIRLLMATSVLKTEYY